MNRIPVYSPPLDLQMPCSHSHLFRRLRQNNWWRLLPYGFWTEPDGSKIYFDREYYPICRERRTGSIQIVSPETWILHDGFHYYFYELAPFEKAWTLEVILHQSRRLNLQNEFQRRLTETSDGEKQREVWLKPWNTGYSKRRL